MKLTFKQLADYPYKSVEEIRKDGEVIGLLERQPGGGPRYKAFLDTGFGCRYLARYYSKAAAVRAILKFT